jgi:thioesterase domain-containing protein
MPPRTRPVPELMALLGEMRAHGMLPPEVDNARVRGFLRVFKAAAQSTYLPWERYQGRITFFRSSETHPEEEMHAEEDELVLLHNWVAEWARYSTEPMDVHVVSGNHVSMLTEPHVGLLAERLRACLTIRPTLG